ncbi:TetR family transcriptional regulator [Sphingobium sp. JS3065]|uniref:TetR/AcrR family transcriptional regulator n=1 Tax=Sphingobium sp. JS3065 TaxID=2970925 RepID=UPI0022648A19|nr:TetR/AcrR family transcriptional regulator [Sphingobium sp. JS3065]UZW57076.1 TetR family transcriptional regulator [Sphingobium sp. JS3065]
MKKSSAAKVRTRLLDAAETLFAEHGFSGVSVRDIVALAGLRISSLTYHFESKRELFAQVIERRADHYIQSEQSSLINAINSSAGHPTAAELVRSYLEPSFRLSSSSGDGWRNYIELAIRSLNARNNDDVLDPLWKNMVTTQNILVESFAMIYPDAEPEDLHWAVHFISATTMHVLLQVGLVDRQSAGLCKSSDMDRILEKMVPFLAAGFDALVGKKEAVAHAAAPDGKAD